MSMVINHNMMAMNAARNLSGTYGKLSTSVQRLSSGLRINTAADDAAGLAIREMMRADIATTQQGIRNAADAISMIQTADGGLAVIDEKLTRMKELAEQAATGTYTTVQREIINSEYQAMAAEIDRIANSTNFNGIKLLDGSVSNQHGGQGIKIHFGTSNNAAEDYYFVNVGDARATSSTGLRVGGDAKNDIWGQGAAGSGPMAGPGCCTAGFTSLNEKAGFTSGQTFSFGYNWDWEEDGDTNLLSGKYLAGRYTVGESDSLQDLIDKVNLGSQARVGIRIDANALTSGVQNGTGTVAVCIGDESYYWGSAGVANGQIVTTHNVVASAASQGSFKAGAGGNPAIYASAGASDLLASAGINLSGKIPPAYTQNDMPQTVSGDAITSALNGPGSYTSAFNKAVSALGDADTVTLTVTSGAAGNITAAEFVSANAAGVSAAGIAADVFDADGNIEASGSMTINTGIWADSNGNWTANSSVAKALGLTEMTVDVSVTSTTGGTITINGTTTTVSADSVDTAADLATAIQNRLATALNGSRTGTSLEITGTAGAVTVGGGQLTAPVAGDLKATPEEKFKDGIIDRTKQKIQVDDNAGTLGGGYDATSLASAINHNPDSEFWAMTEANASGVVDMVYVFAKEGGAEQNSIRACEVGGRDAVSRDALNAIDFENVETGEFHNSGTSMSLGGQDWGSLSPVQTKSNKGNEVWNLTLNGRDVGKERDLWIASVGEITTPGLDDDIINGMDRDSFVEIQNADDGNWKGAEVRTQSAAQEALDALTDAIVRKDKVRADLGAMQNRLENTITNLEIQAENLQASESRISDVDVAKEMTEFTKNNVMVQAAVGMLAQANSMSQMALSLLG